MMLLRLALVQLRISTSAAMAYRSDFILQGAMELVWMALVLLPLVVLYSGRTAVGMTLTAHAGYSFGDFWDGVEGEPSSDYIDWSVGVGYTAGNFELALKWVDTTLEEGDFGFSGDDVFNSEGRAIFTVSTTFPWAKE